MKNKAFNPFTRKSALTLSLFIGTILNAIMLLGYIYNIDNGSVDKFRFMYSFLTNILVLYILYMFCFSSIQRTWGKSPKIWFTVGGAVAIVIPLTLGLAECFKLLVPDNKFIFDLFLITDLVKNLIFVIIVLLSTFLLYTISKRQQTLLENERLIADNMRIRYEALKSQVDPHFLFNSLNTLDGLIGMDTDKAHEYVQHLSLVFRYAISNKEIMQLDDELNFTESYAHLMKIRYGDNFKIQYNIANEYRTWYIMPISLQLLVENAIKHNVISTKYPLTITIETTSNDTVRVSNAIQSKNQAESGEGIGLSNLTERYQLLFQKDISISITNVFCVEIPLIKELEDNKNKNKQNESSNNRGRDCCYPEFATIN